MYVPSQFAVQDLTALHEFMQAHNFATLVTSAPGEGAVATHLPVVLDRSRGSKGTVRGHLSRANPQWKQLAEGVQALLIFQGPHAYISPSWYETAPSVPTWNYVAVHAYGPTSVQHESSWLKSLLADLVEQHEAAANLPWRMENVPSGFLEGLQRGIVGFELRVERIEGKWKLNQHRAEGDRLGPADVLD